MHRLAVLIAAVAGIALANLAEAAPKRAGVTPALIGSAIAILDFNRDAGQWTKAGKPRVDAIESVLRADISAADRDSAWNAYRNPAPPVDVATVVKSAVNKVRQAFAVQMKACEAAVATVLAADRTFAGNLKVGDRELDAMRRACFE